MQPNGIHHITCVTDDARQCVGFHRDLLGLRLVKRTVNQDVPDVWHLFLGDDNGSPGMDLTFFEFRGLPVGVRGAGAAHTVVWRLGSEDSLDFWERRLSEARVVVARSERGLAFDDPEGLGHEFVIYDGDDPPLVATHDSVPAEHAIRGFDGVRAHVRDPDASAAFLRQLLSMEGEGPLAEARGPSRSGRIVFEPAPDGHHVQGSGSIHHVAWTAFGGEGELESWRGRLEAAGVAATPVVDRFWFKAVYFRAPDGILHELSTPEPGFTVDEPFETLGTKLVLPPRFEPYREQIEQRLTPLP